MIREFAIAKTVKPLATVAQPVSIFRWKTFVINYIGGVMLSMGKKLQAVFTFRYQNKNLFPAQ